MVSLTISVLATIVGAAVISYFTAVAVDSHMRTKNYGLEVEYMWLVFRRMMVASSAIVASIYGLTQASDILEALAKVIQG